MAQTVIYTLFLLPGLAVLISAVILNVRGSISARIKRSMSAMLIIVALSMLSYAQYYNASLAARYSWGFDFIYSFVTPFSAPLYFLFVNCLTDIKRRPAINVLVFLPAIIYAVLLISAQALMNSAERHAYICNEILGQDIQIESSVAYSWMLTVSKRIFSVFMPLQGILAMIYGEFRLSTYIRMLEDYTSTYLSKTTKIRGIHTLTILVAVTGLIMSSIPVYESNNQILLVSVAVVGQIILVALIVSYVMKLEYSAEEIHETIEDPTAAIRSVQSVQQVNPVKPIQPVQPVRPNPVMFNEPARKMDQTPSTLMEKIDSAMLDDQLFLEPDLSLLTLCEKVGTNRTYASKAIKDTKGCSFPDYVNRFRLDYAVELMKNTPKESIIVQNIAMQCGCGSIQTFYRYFKLFYNETPTQWIERNK